MDRMMKVLEDLLYDYLVILLDTNLSRRKQVQNTEARNKNPAIKISK